MLTDINKVDLNDDFRRALYLMENGDKNVFVAGRAGTGKSTLLNYFRKTTKKSVAVLAPTGVAALNVEGQTIHSFFRFKPDITASQIAKYDGPGSEVYKNIDTIVIDEISMVRADILDCMDKFLRFNGIDKQKPFGGAKMVFIGDLYQLPPVVSGKEKEAFTSHYKSQYFFDSNVFQKTETEFIELEKIYRQKDAKFIRILNSIRNKSFTDKELKEINERVDPFFRPKAGEFYINLTTTNDMAAAINEAELAQVSGNAMYYKGKIKGNFDEKILPADIDLKLKVGAQIMLLNNDSAHRWVNGTVGKITGIKKSEDKKHDIITAELADRSKVEIEPYTWKMSRLAYDKIAKSLVSEPMGSFTQYPIRLAWAVTIHKGQGKTFDKVIVDIGRGAFSPGQVYVALSRCTSLDGLVLRRPIEKKHIWMDWKIVKFLTDCQYQISEDKCSFESKIKIIQKAIKNKSKLEIVYLKSNDVKSKRVILPEKVGSMEYMGKTYTGVDAYCFSRHDNRVFRVDRIIEIKGA